MRGLLRVFKMALPDGSRRALTEDEALYLGRQVPRARRRIL